MTPPAWPLFSSLSPSQLFLNCLQYIKATERHRTIDQVHSLGNFTLYQYTENTVCSVGTSDNGMTRLSTHRERSVGHGDVQAWYPDHPPPEADGGGKPTLQGNVDLDQKWNEHFPVLSKCFL